MAQAAQQAERIDTVERLAQYGIDSVWRRRAPAARRMLIVYAHPDDESFANAGTIARYTSAGVEVHYACATRGEAGTVASEFLANYPDVAALRTAELNCAASTLGLAGVHYLGYRDSGMEGSADNQHPRALFQAPAEQVTGQIVALIRALRPQVVVTFDPYGGYGHPDHIKIHHATVAAFAAAGDATRFLEHLADGLEPWSPSKLYYSTIGSLFLKGMIILMRLFRKDPRRFGENQDVDLVRAAAEAQGYTTSIESRAFLDQKERAWKCHASQMGGGIGWMARLPRPIRRQLAGADHFTRVVPEWKAQRRKERDLFAGITS